LDTKNKLYSNRIVAQFRLSDNKIFGIPSSYATSNSYQDINAYRGVCGEQIVANLLNLLALETPSMYVFHSVGSKDGDGETDHIIVYKDKILIVETKVFSGYRGFRVSDTGVLYGRKGNKEFKASDNRIMKKVELYQRRFPNRKVEGILAVVRNDIKVSSKHEKYHVVCLDTFYKTIGERMKKATELKEDHWPAVKYFSSLCIKQAD